MKYALTIIFHLRISKYILQTDPLGESTEYLRSHFMCGKWLYGMLAKPPVGFFVRILHQPGTSHSCSARGTGTGFPKGQDTGTQQCCSSSTSTAGAGSGKKLCASAAFFLSHHHPYSAMPCLNLEPFILAETHPENKNTTSHSVLVCIWQNKGKPTPLTHLHRKANTVKPSTEQHYNIRSMCGLAIALMASPTSPPPREGMLTYFIVLELAQGPDSSKMPTRTPSVWQTLHNLLNGDCPLFCGRRAAHCWWGIGNPGTPVILYTKEESTMKSYSGWYLGTPQRKSAVLTPVCFHNMSLSERADTKLKDKEMI